MIKIHRKLEYALMALKVLNERHQGLITVKEVCERLGCPYDGMAKVMQLMGQEQNLLASEQGVTGGYRLVADLSNISFYSLMEKILGPVEIAKCLKANRECELIDKCNILSPINSLNSKVVDFYKTLSVGEVLEGSK